MKWTDIMYNWKVLPKLFDSSALTFPLKPSLQDIVEESLNSLQYDAGLIVDDIICLAAPHAVLISTALFCKGYLVSNSLKPEDLKVVYSNCVERRLFERNDVGKLESIVAQVKISNKEREVTFLSYMNCVLVCVLATLNNKTERIGFDPYYIERGRRALEILESYSFFTRFEKQLLSFSIIPQGAESLFDIGMKDYSASYQISNSLKIYSKTHEYQVKPIHLRSLPIQIYHFALIHLKSSTIFTPEIQLPPEWFCHIYSKIYDAYSDLSKIISDPDILEYSSEQSFHLHPREETSWYLTCAVRKSDTHMLYICYEGELCEDLLVVLYTLMY
jgi:hypothetical protein